MVGTRDRSDDEVVHGVGASAGGARGHLLGVVGVWSCWGDGCLMRGECRRSTT